jgi:hypothetical protein
MHYRCLRAFGKVTKLQRTAASFQTDDMEQHYLIKRQKVKRMITEEKTENFEFGLSFEYIYYLVIC